MSRLYNSLAGKITDAENIADLCSALNKCRDLLESWSINRDSFADYLIKRLSERAVYLDSSSRLKIFPSDAVRVYKDTNACLAYLAFKAGYCGSAVELVSQMDDLLSLMSSRTTEPKTAVLNEAEISLLLELLQDKYNFIENMTHEKRLEIYIINRSHICYDSWLLTYKNTYTDKWINKWMVMSFAPTVDIPFCGRHFVFLHEMGHILYNEITDGGAALPPMFSELLTIVTSMSIRTDSFMLPELFSDLFAAATMNGSSYARLNPYHSILPKELMQLLEEYFLILISKAGTGFYGGDVRKVLH